MSTKDGQIIADQMEKKLNYIKAVEVFEKRIELPEDPGVYKFFNEDFELLYVGKAKNLKNRVSSYLSKGDTKKQKSLRAQINYVDLILTKTESDALILEQSLIRKHKPPYNVQFRDDKSYPIIHIASAKEFPNIFISRQKQKEGTSFGPYANVGAMRKNLEMCKKIFKIRDCKDVVFKNRTRPCIEYQIGRCSAPCVGLISQKDYKKDVERVEHFLNGKNERVLKDLYKNMDKYSEQKDYERAILFRDKINAIRDIQKNQSILTLYQDIDVIAFKKNKFSICISLVEVRDGWISTTKNFFLEDQKLLADKAMLLKFIETYYLDSSEKNINLIANLDLSSHKSELEDTLNKNLKFIKRSKKNEPLLEIAESQAMDRINRRNTFEWVKESFSSLKEKLNLPNLERIEAFDISHNQGNQVTASCVCFTENGPDKKNYRSMNLTLEKNDDYLALSEAVRRRLKNLKDNNKTFPDLLVIDGGKGQLNSVVKELEKNDLKKINIISISKGPKRNEKYDEIHLLKPPFKLNIADLEGSSKLIQLIRNESHRFAIKKHRQRRSNSYLKSEIDQIPSIGKKYANLLIRHFGGTKRLKEATYDDLLKVNGIGEQKAKLIKKYLN
ncbi:MAG: excinuclease ABC subunit UvrC [Gammaproteobacteria bacterium]